MISIHENKLLRSILAAMLSVFLLVGCASDGDFTEEQFAQSDDGFSDVDQDVDPLEGLNRFTFAINQFLDTMVFRPLAATYRVLLPQFMRDSIRSFLRNLNTPVILANDLLQGSWDRAGTTLTRFAINTTAGVGGLYDAADDFGYPYHDEDFGQTLGVWGIGPNPYLVNPILGPSTLRDSVGILVDSFFDPLTYVLDDEILLGRTFVRGIDFRSRNIEALEDLERDAVDFYARLRSVYLQRRVDEINNGDIDEDQPAPGLTLEDPADSQFSSFE